MNPDTTLLGDFNILLAYVNRPAKLSLKEISELNYATEQITNI